VKNLTFSLSGKVTLVSGAAGGIGSSIVELFAAAGAKIFLSGLQEDKLIKLADSLRKDNLPNDYKAVDITVPEVATELVGSVIDSMGSIDILVNCAGINRPQNAEEVTEKTGTISWTLI